LIRPLTHSAESYRFAQESVAPSAEGVLATLVVLRSLLASGGLSGRYWRRGATTGCGRALPDADASFGRRRPIAI